MLVLVLVLVLLVQRRARAKWGQGPMKINRRHPIVTLFHRLCCRSTFWVEQFLTDSIPSLSSEGEPQPRLRLRATGETARSFA